MSGDVVIPIVGKNLIRFDYVKYHNVIKGG
jgi:hypothetical protein